NLRWRVQCSFVLALFASFLRFLCSPQFSDRALFFLLAYLVRAMTRDDIRVESIRRALDEAGLDALICALPHNVLLLSGYCPLAGAALTVATREGRTALIAPSDEMEIAERALSDEVRKYQVPTLDRVGQTPDPLWLPLREAAADLAIEKGRIGYER